MPECISILLRALRIELRAVRRTLFPVSGVEAGLFLFFFLLYGWMGYHVLYDTDLMEPSLWYKSSYLGYENLYHLYAAGGVFDLLHPFFCFFHLFKNLLITLLITLLKGGNYAVISLIITDLLITGGLVLLYRYLKQIVLLSTHRALLLTLFCGSFFTTVVLSFTPETYPFSFFLLLFSLLMLSREYKLTGRIKGRTAFFLSFLCGGATATNALKPVLAAWLNKTSFLHKLQTTVRILLSFAVCVFFLWGVYACKDFLFKPEVPVEKSRQFSIYEPKEESFSKHALIDFWGNTVITTPLVPQPVDKVVVYRPTEYLHGWLNAVVVFLLLLVVASVCFNLGNRYVWLLLMFLGVDAVIHFVFRFGMNEGVLFGGHWLFAVPILIGWFYTKLPVRMYRVLDWIVVLLFFITFTQNCVEFIRLWEEIA